MKGIVLAIASVALLAGCANNNRGGVGDDVNRETGAYERPSDYMPNYQSSPGDREGINNAPVQPRAPGGIGPTEPR